MAMRALTVWAVLGGAVVLVPGCGGSEEEAPAPAAARQPPPAAGAAGKPAAGAQQKPAGPQAQIARRRSTPRPQRTQFPEDFAEWTDDHFRAAKKENNRQLASAIEELAGRPAKDEATAALLIELLRNEPEKEGEKVKPAAGRGSFGGSRARGGMGGRGGSARGTSAAIIAALAAGGSEAAQRTLREVVEATFPTGVPDAQITDLSLAALVDRFGRSAIDFYYEVLTHPEQLRGEGRGEMTPEELRELALGMLPSVESPYFRAKLAAVLIEPDHDATLVEAARDLLLAPTVSNLPAQAKIYGSGKADEETVDTLHPIFLDHSLAALRQLMDIPESAPLGASGSVRRGSPRNSGFQSNRRPSAPSGMGARRRAPAQGGLSRGRPQPSTPDERDPKEDAYLTARVLWTHGFAGAVQRNAGLITEDTPRRQEWLNLAASLPLQEVRFAMSQFLDDYWDSGTGDLDFGGRYGETIADPGLLLVLKSAPRKMDPDLRKERDEKAKPAPASRRPTGRYSAPRPSEEKETKRHPDQPKFEWMAASEQFTQVLNERFHAAALARADSGGRVAAGETSPIRLASFRQASDESADSPEDDPFGTAAEAAGEAALDSPVEFPIQLHPEAKVTAEYHLQWPADLGDKLKGAAVAPLVVHYVRIEEKILFAKLSGLYSRQLKGARPLPLENGRWFDLVEPGTHPLWLRSIDVMITRQANSARSSAPATERGRRSTTSRRSKPEDLVIEILVIEIPDPLAGTRQAEQTGDSQEAADQNRDT